MEIARSEKKIGSINVRKTFEIDEGSFYLIISILCFLVIFGGILIFGVIYFFNPGVLFSPHSISLFLLSLDPDVHKVVYGDVASAEEKEIVRGFVLNYLEEFKSAEGFGSDEVVIGLGSSFSEAPYLDYLESNDSVAIYNSEVNSLYVYSRDLEKLRETLNILNREELEYAAVKVNDGEVEELMIK